MLASNGSEVFEYAYQHLMLVAWPTIIYFVWRASKFVTETTATAVKVVDQVDKMTTNCFPTMQKSLENQDGLLHSMDQSLKIIAERTPEQAKAASASRRRK
jgi:hypothetical protein